ncbi:hairy-related 12 [Menidia menidia]
MAPCSNSYSSMHNTRMSEKDNIKLRKPVVEKMRRDRINTCIEQLRVILEKEFHKQEPNSKLEKADILEMTVSFLRQQLQSGLCGGPGFPPCWRDSLLAPPSASTEAPAAPLQALRPQNQTLHQTQRASLCSSACSTLRPTSLPDGRSRGPVWRPW